MKKIKNPGTVYWFLKILNNVTSSNKKTGMWILDFEYLYSYHVRNLSSHDNDFNWLFENKFIVKEQKVLIQ